jgi:8-amino-7-oxononanoate synthase
MSFPSLAAIKVVYSIMKQGATGPVRTPSRHNLNLLTHKPQLITHLNSLITHFYTLLLTLNNHTTHPATNLPLLYLPQEIPRSPIFSLLTPEPRSLAKWCQEAGFVVRPIVPPTVPEGTQRVRVCLHAGNTMEDIEGLAARIRGWLVEKKKVEGAEMERIEVVKARL